MSKAAVALLVLAALVSIPPATARSVPRLTLSDRPSFAVKGRGFAAGEHVRVVVRVGGANRAKKVTAAPNGTFIARFHGLHVKACATVRVKARGDRGSGASLRIAATCIP